MKELRVNFEEEIIEPFELRVNFEANLSSRAEHVFQKFCETCSEYEKSDNENGILVQIHNQIFNYWCVVYLEALDHYQESPWL